MRDLLSKPHAWLTTRDDEEGQGMVEYGLIIAFVALVVIAALLFLGPQVANFFNNAGNSVG